MSMNQPLRVAVLVGSLRQASLSKKVARLLIERAPASLACRVVELGELPLYNEDLEQEAPQAWQTFRRELRASDAVLFVTPEYNRSIPGCLKNALDVGSRPAGQNVFEGLPAAVMSVTPYRLGAFGANHALRQTFVFLNMPAMQQPEAYISEAAEIFDDAGNPKDERAAARFDKFMASFAIFAQQLRAGAAQEFEAFLEQRREAASAYVRGDAAPLLRVVTQHEPATFFSPRADTLQGAQAVAERYGADAKSFAEGGTTELQILQAGASGTLAFWTGLQRAQVSHAGQQSAMTLRITEVFRVEAGSFKLVHRHADPLKD